MTGITAIGTFRPAMVPHIVITGAPASGKTEVWKRLKSEPAFSHFVFFDELARQLLVENPGYRDNWSQFHLEIYRRQLARERQIGDKPFITDRGTVDAFAFHPQTLADVETTLKKEYSRYSTVLQLGSTAVLGEQFYQRDEVRSEPASAALEIETAIAKVWRGHPGYYFVKADTDFDKKYDTCLQILLGLI